MSACAREYTFNSAITAISEDKGAFDEDAHRQLVLPIRGQLMQIDGICGVFIARYGVRVEYVEEATDKAALDVAVADAIARTINGSPSKSDYFPLRGSKQLRLICKEASKVTEVPIVLN